MQRSILIIGAIAAPILFCSGLLVGRQFPAHHYERFGDSVYLYDTSSGRVCTIKHPQSIGDLWGPPPKDATGTPDPYAKYIVTPSPYPVCGE